jgi:hypothetical protein
METIERKNSEKVHGDRKPYHIGSAKKLFLK